MAIMALMPTLLPPATKLGQGNIFTGVCDSVHRGICLSACWDATPTPQDQAPPSTPLHQAPPDQAPPRAEHAGMLANVSKYEIRCQLVKGITFQGRRIFGSFKF